MNILVIEDRVRLANTIAEALRTQNHIVDIATDGLQGYENAASGIYDVLVLDLMLPQMNGYEVLSELRKTGINIPVLILSARTELADKVQGFTLGADDYLTKPFEIEELLARIVVQLRKSTRPDSSEKLMYREITVNMVTHEAWVGEHEVKLTKTEFAILKILLEHPKQVITKTVLLDRVSEETPDCMESSLRVHISNLRKKLREISGKDYIEAVWGIGFKMAE